MSVIHAKRFVGGMSEMELVLLKVCCYLEKIEDY
jgi:hypothetical protein